MDSYKHLFPAIRGVQAKKEYYVAMCPLKLVPKILEFDNAKLPPEYRSQRILNKSRIPSLAEYIVNNRKDYIFSALTVSIDSEVDFQPIEGTEDRSLGQLAIPMTANIIVNDGQHRRAAIEQALEKCPELGNETISIVFFLDAGLKRSQQMFADLNRYAIRPTRSLSILYDHRDDFSLIVHDLIQRVQFFDGMIELEKTSISNRSQKLFTLSSLYAANKALLINTLGVMSHEENLAIASEFWSKIIELFPDWAKAKDNKISCLELRKTYVYAHGVVLHAMGIMGAELLQQFSRGWKGKLASLKKIDWARTNSKDWEGRAMVGGKMSKTTNNVRLTANFLKKKVGVKLNKDELVLEKSHKKKA